MSWYICFRARNRLLKIGRYGSNYRCRKLLPHWSCRWPGVAAGEQASRSVRQTWIYPHAPYTAYSAFSLVILYPVRLCFRIMRMKEWLSNQLWDGTAPVKVKCYYLRQRRWTQCSAWSEHVLRNCKAFKFNHWCYPMDILCWLMWAFGIALTKTSSHLQLRDQSRDHRLGWASNKFMLGLASWYKYLMTMVIANHGNIESTCSHFESAEDLQRHWFELHLTWAPAHLYLSHLFLEMENGGKIPAKNTEKVRLRRTQGVAWVAW